ncbi:L-ascorbate metabolism protein UlaG, beta-lactamase superfamily [Micromonospora rhizosphaerae]|uniref:L-ascorbate metabolism protein UlaG, beta-lactamase superfamily n=1 Tax=Micromonospora rhizosphaerae TaxID=568872 RepID=A0A1C6RTK0_9ACTN|nr:MBL fold metallo-hydrolase [Micromonospora rhizosphaerae]SCL20542.1 L-ascorbate metabolism protein UlaG, beta-lactamase superfamily [Micromonospora rhizosphaerae]
MPEIRTPDRGLDRRRFLRDAAVGTAAVSAGGLGGAALATPAQAATVAPVAATSAGRRGAVSFRWWGTSGWRIDIGDRTVLVDPYLSRLDTGLFRGAFNPATPLQVNTAVVDSYLDRAENVLVTHTHWDHFHDVPHIATKTGARVFGTLTAYHLGLAYGVPAGQLSPVKGGEVLDFGDYTVEVVSSLHSRNGAYSVALPGVRVSQPPRPATIADLPEGDTLAYQIRVADGPAVFFMGASDFVERNLAGLAPDVAMVASAATTSTADYVPRLLAALDYPKVVVPVHWDNFETPLTNPPVVAPADRKRLDDLIAAVRRVSPRTRVIVPEYHTAYHF